MIGRWMVFAVVLGALGCSLDHTEVLPGPCGADGQRCCRPDELAARGFGAGGCAAGHVCVAGAGLDGGVASRNACRRCPASAPGVCDGACVDLRADTRNCGRCGTRCAAGEACVASGAAGDAGVADGGASAVCQQGCPSGQDFCPGRGCSNRMTDPANCGACGTVCGNGKACLGGICQQLALYSFSGVQLNVPIANLTGWTQCLVEPYSNGSTTIATVNANCTGTKMLLGCRTAGSATLSVLANAPKVDVMFDTGSTNTPHNANNVGWYYNGSVSWGFAPQGSVINRSSCDIVDSASYPGGGATDGDFRICWHTGGSVITSGWRCGKPDFLGATYERLIFTAP